MSMNKLILNEVTDSSEQKFEHCTFLLERPIRSGRQPNRISVNASDKGPSINDFVN